MSITQLYQRCTFRPGESLVSFVSRMALRNRFDAADDFCTPMRIAFDPWDFGEPFALEGISKASGVPVAKLQAITFRREREDFYLGSERITKRMVHEYHVYACPGCLRDDRRDRRTKLDQGFYGRTKWLLSVFRSCPYNAVALVPVAVASAGSPSERHDFARLLRKYPPSFRKLISEARYRGPSQLEEYVRQRLNCTAREAVWLDQMDLYAAIQTCEMLGLLLNVGPTARPVEKEDAQWHRAGDAGFRYAVRGREGIGSALSEARLRVRFSPPGLHDPTTIFGFFYRWLLQNPRDPAFDRLREFFKEHVGQTTPASTGRIGGRIVGREDGCSIERAGNGNTAAGRWR